jgi:RNA polymerase sigma factor (sigma-70 family)
MIMNSVPRTAGGPAGPPESLLPELLARVKKSADASYLYSHARRKVRAQDVDDVVADTVFNLLQTIQKADYLTLAYLAKAVVMASSRYQRLRSHSDLAPQLNLLAQDCPPDGGVELEQAFPAVEQWWQGLSDFQRKVLACRYCLGMTIEETARVLNVPMSRVYSHERKALESLRQALRREGFDRLPECTADLLKLAYYIFRLLWEAVPESAPDLSILGDVIIRLLSGDSPDASGDDDQEPFGTSE